MNDSSLNDEDPEGSETDQLTRLRKDLADREIEVGELRQRLVQTPRRIHELETAKRDADRELAKTRARNQKLSSTLESNRERMATLKDEVEKLTGHPYSKMSVFWGVG